MQKGNGEWTEADRIRCGVYPQGKVVELYEVGTYLYNF